MRMVTATNVTFLTVAIYLLDLGIKIVALGLVPEGRRPSSATAWLLLILFLPVIGLLAFWLIGSPFVDRGRRRQQAAAGEVISGALTAESNDLLPVPLGPHSIPSSYSIGGWGGCPLLAATRPTSSATTTSRSRPWRTRSALPNDTCTSSSTS
jgi:Phospholipase_D-nuclease N-terminal